MPSLSHKRAKNRQRAERFRSRTKAVNIPTTIIHTIDTIRPLLVTNNDSPSRPDVIITAVSLLATQLGVIVTPVAPPPAQPLTDAPTVNRSGTLSQSNENALQPVPASHVFEGGKTWVDGPNVFVAFGRPDHRKEQLKDRGYKPDPQPTGFRWRKECPTTLVAVHEFGATLAMLGGVIGNTGTGEGQPTKV